MTRGRSDAKIGIAKENIKEGDVIATVYLCSGEVFSDKIKFLPYGKVKLLKKLFMRDKGVKDVAWQDEKTKV